MNITALTCVKNEGPFLLEWIAYNRVIGVTDFMIYHNDCTDGTDRLLEKLQEHGIVETMVNPAKGRNYQMEALKKSRRRASIKKADWVWVADVDEFLNIHVGDHTIPALIEACGNPQCISVTFQFFASCGIEKYEDKPVIEQFLYSHNPDIWTHETAIEVKSLVRSDFPMTYFGAHRPFHDGKNLPRRKQPTWTDGSGQPVMIQFIKMVNKRRIRKYPSKGVRNFATLNHYAVRSLDSYLVKNDRGDVNREFREFDDTYWRERNDAAYFDDSILRYKDKLAAEMDRLKALDGIGALHDECVALHKAKLEELMAQDTYQAMRKQLQTCSPYPPNEAELRELIGMPA
ncbi:glycosyltransferase family 2 protein [Lentibacter sp. XHP0401]|jgi:Glycosyl transferase family 2|uniref:glycosyltransferase family 2 protein n=1 Tax=Lentibacter sp. XHP0401 TaxID=2984334 RepID=UPI0021E72D5C|nr:glycosyltransferase family 2 protein [Lentibacter sp. XHP0401]MCV2891877.1 glycosyltransferase family 2 protein [Lentibacter sp. XHP0401]